MTTQPPESSSHPLVYRNAMESLVAQEVERQFKGIPPRLSRYLSKEEVAAFALNRLPALYATHERGWKQQCIRGKRDFSEQIQTAVRQGVAAVQRDPLRLETPLVPPQLETVGVSLQRLQSLLRREDLTWENLPDVVEQTLIETARGEIHWQQQNYPTTKPYQRPVPWADQGSFRY